jgi:Flp pilus assembly protein TadG
MNRRGRRVAGPIDPRGDARGQSLVEFSLSLLVFLGILLVIFDVGRGIYMSNGVAEAAREIARTTSVHRGSTLGTSAQTIDSVATQQGLIPGLGTPTYTCVDISGATVTGTCAPGDFVKVSIAATWQPITGQVLLLGIVGPLTARSVSVVQVP